jgi:hypothetical protein
MAIEALAEHGVVLPLILPIIAAGVGNTTEKNSNLAASSSRQNGRDHAN